MTQALILWLLGCRIYQYTKKLLSPNNKIKDSIKHWYRYISEMYYQQIAIFLQGAEFLIQICYPMLTVDGCLKTPIISLSIVAILC